MAPLLLLRRRFSSSASPRVPLSHPAYMIWAANTSLGKTLVSTGLAASFLLSHSPETKPLLKKKKFVYLKPVQTGFPSDSDSRFVYSKLLSLSRRFLPLPFSSLLASNSVSKASFPAANSLGFGIQDLDFREQERVSGGREGIELELRCETLYAWKEAVSPHLAAERESGAVEDSELVEMMEKCLASGLECEGGGVEAFCIVETSGGVASPAPSRALQCDLYRPFRLPGVLVGDGRLGGISSTISAYESLRLRGYDISAVVFEDHGLVNEVPLLSYLRNRVPVILLPPIPQDMSNDLGEWFCDSKEAFSSLKEVMLLYHFKRIERLMEMQKKAGDVFWWPFTQHRLVLEDSVTIIDSRCGGNFAVCKVSNDAYITQQFDACASWWTQGPDAALQTELARVMAYAASRYGHVMFPENVYEPALDCAELLLEGVGKGWASRVFFSDNGSTAIEIALKMAFRKFCSDNGILSDFVENNATKACIDLKVLALNGSYHGDTLGAMEAQAPSSYTGFLQQPWYTGRGVFLDPPTIFMCDGVWHLSLPEAMLFKIRANDDIIFHQRKEIFDRSRDKTDLADFYSSCISSQLSECLNSGGKTCVGALIMEPVIQGAGGMLMIDPLYQRVLVRECRDRCIPVVFDEVFTGFWRLGSETAAELLGCVPDIACFAKLMTGGVIPLAATLATNAVFDSFVGDSKLKALLHGHSYCGHAMGCAAATKAIRWFKDPLLNANISNEGGLLKELWDQELVHQISSHPSVQRVVALGTLFALELRAQGSNAGYASLYARSLLQMLREDGVYMRPLGNVIYLMCGPCTSPSICSQLLIKLQSRLEEFHHAAKQASS